jgi:hypothetical protein
MRRLTALTTLMTLLFTSAIGLINAQPRDDEALRALLAAPADCPMPCWEGIRPGKSVAQAISILQAHPWVGRLDLRGPTITWEWSGQQPAYIDGTARGALATYWDRVTSVMIPTRLTFGDILLAFDLPLQDSYVALRGTALIAHTSVYADFAVYNQLACPFGIRHIWAQPVALIMERSLLDRNRAIADFVDYRAPLWRRGMSVCDEE